MQGLAADAVTDAVELVPRSHILFLPFTSPSIPTILCVSILQKQSWSCFFEGGFDLVAHTQRSVVETRPFTIPVPIVKVNQALVPKTYG